MHNFLSIKNDFLSEISFSKMLNLIWVWEMDLTTKDDEANTAHLSQDIMWNISQYQAINPVTTTMKEPPWGRITARVRHQHREHRPSLHGRQQPHTQPFSHSCGRLRRSGSDNIYIAPLCTVLRPQQTQSESLRCSDDCHKISCHKNWFEAKERKWRHTPK